MNFPLAEQTTVVGPLAAKQEEQLTKSGIHNQTADSKAVTVGGITFIEIQTTGEKLKEAEMKYGLGVKNCPTITSGFDVPLVSPYECYWSRRALAAEKELQDLKNHIAGCLV